MNCLKLIHNSEQFLLKINNTEIKKVSGYEIKSDANTGNTLEVSLKISIDISQSSIDIENDKIELK